MSRMKCIIRIFILFVSLLLLKMLLKIYLIENSNKTIQINSTKQLNQSIFMNDQVNVSENEKFQILLWTKWYRKKWIDLLDKNPKCEYSNCVFIDDRTKLNTSDAVVFHWRNTNPKDFPKQMFDHQKWVLFNVESPHHTVPRFNRIGLKKIDWIMSYRTDSDIYSPYGYVVKCNTNWKQKYSFENKTKSIAWFVSHCKTPSKREIYVRKLKKYIDVDIYGKCGPLKCQKNNNDNCVKMIEQKYKFYLSFENSICKDYVTEKAFEYMKYDLIPIVLGGADYSSIFPPNSYINVFNFKSPQHLAKYLQRVGTNESLYNSYFEWKNNYCIENVLNYKNMCQLCKHLNENLQQNNIQTKVKRKKWWEKEANCRTIEFKNDTLQLVRARNGLRN